MGRFEKVKRLFLTLSPFTVEEGTLTPTFKMRRCVLTAKSFKLSTFTDYPPILRKDAYSKFKREIDAMYELPEPGARSQL